MTSASAGLRATWVPAHTRRYRRPGGPWDGPSLDALLSVNGGEVVSGKGRFLADAVEALVARVAVAGPPAGVRRGQRVAWQLPNGLAPLVLARACWRIGPAATPVLHSLGPVELARGPGQVYLTRRCRARPAPAGVGPRRLGQGGGRCGGGRLDRPAVNRQTWPSGRSLRG